MQKYYLESLPFLQLSPVVVFYTTVVHYQNQEMDVGPRSIFRMNQRSF